MQLPSYPINEIAGIIAMVDLVEMNNISLTVQKESHLYSHQQLEEIYRLLSEKIAELTQNHYN
jgi:hypothetical protein